MTRGAGDGGGGLAEVAPSLEVPVTVCVLCYGANSGLARRFLERLYADTDPAHFELRAGLNEVVGETRELFEGVARRYGNVRIVEESTNVYKCPMMRQLFHLGPLGRWVVWFDDDSYPTRPDWLQRLGLRVEGAREVVQWGHRYAVDVGDDVREVVEAAPWYRGLPLARRESPPDPASPYRIDFIVGGFWAIRSEVIRDLDWPDPRIVQAGDDFLLGEALRQGGYRIGSFESGVAVNTAERRNAAARPVWALGEG